MLEFVQSNISKITENSYENLKNMQNAHCARVSGQYYKITSNEFQTYLKLKKKKMKDSGKRSDSYTPNNDLE